MRNLLHQNIAEVDSCLESLKATNQPLTSPPVILHWDRPKDKAIRQLTLSLRFKGAVGRTAIKDRTKGCDAVTFGSSKGVLGESYRKTFKLDSDQRSTTLNRHGLGIVDGMAQTLILWIKERLNDGETMFKAHIRMMKKLYKLN